MKNSDTYNTQPINRSIGLGLGTNFSHLLNFTYHLSHITYHISPIQLLIISHLSQIEVLKNKQSSYDVKLTSLEQTQTILYDTVQKLWAFSPSTPQSIGNPGTGTTATGAGDEVSRGTGIASTPIPPRAAHMLGVTETLMADQLDTMILDNQRLMAENIKDSSNILSTDSTSLSLWPETAIPKVHPPLIMHKTFSSSSSKSLPHSIYLPENILPLREKCLHFNSAVNDLLQPILPHNANYQYRQSILAFLKNQIRRLFHCSSFEIGIGRVKCFLPDDPMKLCVITGRNSTISWHSVLSDGLNALAEKVCVYTVHLY